MCYWVHRKKGRKKERKISNGCKCLVSLSLDIPNYGSAKFVLVSSSVFSLPYLCPNALFHRSYPPYITFHSHLFNVVLYMSSLLLKILCRTFLISYAGKPKKFEGKGRQLNKPSSTWLSIRQSQKLWTTSEKLNTRYTIIINWQFLKAFFHNSFLD